MNEKIINLRGYYTKKLEPDNYINYSEVFNSCRAEIGISEDNDGVNNLAKLNFVKYDKEHIVSNCAFNNWKHLVRQKNCKYVCIEVVSVNRNSYTLFTKYYFVDASIMDDNFDILTFDYEIYGILYKISYSINGCGSFADLDICNGGLTARIRLPHNGQDRLDINKCLMVVNIAPEVYCNIFICMQHYIGIGKTYCTHVMPSDRKGMIIPSTHRRTFHLTTLEDNDFSKIPFEEYETYILNKLKEDI